MAFTPESRSFHLHLVSDATGETVTSAARACLSQFDSVEPIEHFWNLVRTRRQLDMVLDEIEEYPGPVLFTLLDDQLRARLEERCRAMPVPAVAVLDPVFESLAAYLGVELRKQRPGQQHALDAVYFDRMEAMDFALSHDDGQSHWELTDADVVLIGVSRTSKTPTCLYLANRGVKAANVPFVPGVPLPTVIDQLSERTLIVGLTNDPSVLVQIRKSRLSMLGQQGETDYIDPDRVRAEVTEARRLFTRRGWPVIDTTRRSIEETAAEVITMLSRRRRTVTDHLRTVR